MRIHKSKYNKIQDKEAAPDFDEKKKIVRESNKMLYESSFLLEHDF